MENIDIEKNNVINIVCTPDHNFAMPTGVMLESLLENNSDENIHVFILKDDIFTREDESDIKTIINKFSKSTVSFFDAGHFLSNYPQIGKVSSYISKATYYRLFIPEILKTEDKCLYLDGDLIVRHSIYTL